MTITVNPHAAAILSALAALESHDVPIQVGDGIAPRSTDGKTIVAPCAVLHIRPGGEFFSSVGCADTDAVLPFQVTCVGRTAEQARIVADAVAGALDGASLTVTGREIFRVRRSRGLIGGVVERDEAVTPPLFYIPVQYQLLTAAA